MPFTPSDGPKQRRQVTRSGARPLSYMGVMPESPTNYVTFDKDPTTKDFRNWEVGDEWENRTTKDVFKLVDKGRGAGGTEGFGTWVRYVIGTGNFDSLKDNAGTEILPDATGAITIKAGELIDTTASANTITIDFQRSLLNGQIPIGAMGAATQYANITAGANVVVTDGPNSITISAAGGGAGDLTAVGNDGSTATAVFGSMNILGGLNIATSGDMADTFTVAMDNVYGVAPGVNNQILAADATGAFGTVDITAADLADNFPADVGIAVPALGSLTVAGGQNVNTSAAASTVTVNVNDTYQVVVDPVTLEIGTVDATQLLGSISIADLKTLLGLP